MITNKEKCIFWFYVASIVFFYWLGGYNVPEKIKIETKIKTETVVQEKIRVKTVIKESPNGSKETIITYQNDKNTKEKSLITDKKLTTSKQHQWSVAVGRSLESYYIGIDRRIISNLSGGINIPLSDIAGIKNSIIYIRYQF